MIPGIWSGKGSTCDTESDSGDDDYEGVEATDTLDGALNGGDGD